MDPKFFRKYADIITEAEKVDEAGPPSAMQSWLNSPITQKIEQERERSHSPSLQPGQNPARPNPNNKPTQEAEQTTNETIPGQIKSAVKNASLKLGVGPRAQAHQDAVVAQQKKADDARKEYDLYNPLRIGHDPNDDAPRAAANAERKKQQHRLEKLGGILKK
jgi:hypothetical protein